MRELQIKTERLASRCEICHQSDCFDALENRCARCATIDQSLMVIIKPRNKATFRGPVLRFFTWENLMTRQLLMVRNVLIGGVIVAFAILMFFFNPLIYSEEGIITWSDGVNIELDQVLFIHLIWILCFGVMVTLLCWLKERCSSKNL